MGEQGTHGDIARELAQWRAFVSLREGVAAEDVDGRLHGTLGTDHGTGGAAFLLCRYAGGAGQ